MAREQRTAVLPAIPQAKLRRHQHPLLWWAATIATVVATAIAVVVVAVSAVVLRMM
jgi:type IV secretory pathway component VirB8